MNVAHISLDLDFRRGGPPRVVTGLVEALRKRGHTCSISGDGTPLRTACSDSEITRSSPNLLNRFWRGYGPGLRPRMQQDISLCDIVHIHELWHYPHYLAAKLAILLRKPYVVTIHGGLAEEALKVKRWRKNVYWHLAQERLLRNASCIHVFTQAERSQVESKRIARLIAEIPNGVALEEFASLPSRDTIGKVHPKVKGQRVILFLGRILPVKGLDVLCGAFAKLAADPKFSDCVLLLCGPIHPSYKATLEEILRKNFAIDRTVFTGPLDHVRRLEALAAADVFALPSHSEGFSISVLEALAARLPVVISPACNFPSVETSGAGLVSNCDISSFESALRTLLEDPSRRSEMGANGRRLVELHYSWDRLAAQFEDLYSKLLSEGSIPAAGTR